MQHYSIAYGNKTLSFSLLFSARKTVGIYVLPDKKIKVIAPLHADISRVKKIVEKRAAWITKKIRLFNGFQLPENRKEYVSGETHLYSGRQYRLKISKSKEESVKLRGKYIFIHSNSKQPKQVKQLLDDWYKERAIKKFSDRLNICYMDFKREKIGTPKISLRKMSKRWGSCTKKGLVLLNPELIKAPVYCIDYVITHEICHLKYHDHSKKFYRLLDEYMPDWEKRKRRLEKVMI